MISKHLDKKNLHHAYLIEGEREKIIPEILEFVRSLGVDTNANSDFSHISLDSFKIEDARNLKSLAGEKSYSSSRRVFLVSVNSFLLEAQNSLLKMFEEPIENTHFFVVMSDTNSLLATFISRFYLIKKENSEMDTGDAERFISMPLQKRIDFIKDMLVEPEEEDEEGNEVAVIDSTRSKILKFLNMLEVALHSRLSENSSTACLEHIFKVREFLRMPGSSPKTLMESVALIVPNLKN